MVLDIIVCLILIISMALGFWRGFFCTFINTFGLVIAAGAGLFFKDDLKNILMERTEIYERIRTSIEKKIDDIFENNIIPEILNGLKEDAASDIAAFITKVLCFILIVSLVYLIFFLISHLFSKKHNDGFIGFFDGLLGLTAGIFRGFAIVFLFLALLFPVLSFISPELSQSAADSLSGSFVSSYLYNNNIILKLL